MSIADKRLKIISLVKILESESNIVKFFNHFLQSMSSELDKETFVKISDFINEEFIPSVIDDIYNVYEAALDEEVLDDILAFFNSETGKNFIAIKDAVKTQMEEHTKVWQDRLNAYMAQFIEN